jgi:hypothetical protein
MQRLESALIELEAKVTEAEKAAAELLKAAKQLRQAARLGNIQNLERGLEVVAERGVEAAAAARSLKGEWSFDTRGYLTSGYASELSNAATEKGVKLFEREGQLFAFPLLLTVDPREVVVRAEEARTQHPTETACRGYRQDAKTAAASERTSFLLCCTMSIRSWRDRNGED